MSKIIIKNERLAATVRTDDASEAFSSAISNGQIRLAMDLLGEVIPEIVNRLESIENASAQSQPAKAPAPKVTKESAQVKESDASIS